MEICFREIEIEIAFDVRKLVHSLNPGIERLFSTFKKEHSDLKSMNFKIIK